MKSNNCNTNRMSMPIIITFIALISSFGKDKTIYKKALGAQADGNHQEAVTYFEQSLESEGENSECLANIGLSLHQISKSYLNKSFKSLKKALKIDPNHEESLGYLGEIYLLQGNLVKSNEILMKLKKLKSDESEALQIKFDKIISQLEEIKK